MTPTTHKPNPPNLPTKREVIKCLNYEIDMFRQSYQEGDWGNWAISDSDALHFIRCLEAALLLVRSKFPKVRRGG